MDKSIQFVLIAFVMSIVEIACLWGSKKYGESQRKGYLCVSVIGYAIISVLIGVLSADNKIGIVNSVWNAISICTSILLGYLAFGEKLTAKEMVGVVTLLCGIVMTQVK